MKKVALHNLGCKVNSYEVEVMQQQLLENGYEIVPFEEKADVYIVNTCSVTNIADRKSRQMLHKAKKENPEAIIVAAGCYVQTRPQEEILADGVDLLLGNDKKNSVVELLDSYFDGIEGEQEYVIDIESARQYENMNLQKTMDHTRAYIKVQDGCNQFCSYCIIPFSRGRVRSRKMENAVKEIAALCKEGYREFVLTGIHLSSYGLDFAGDVPDKNDWLKHSKLIELIEEIAKIPGVERIRLGSFEPRIITEDFVTRLARIPSICPHFHLSLQSGCDETLKRMNRHYTAAEYMESVKLIRDIFFRERGFIPAITTDVIVGFPGETKEEFEVCYEFLKRVEFYETHIFKYSKRKGTRAAVMPRQLTDHEKTERSKVLQKLNKENKERYIKSICDARDYVSELLVEETVEIEGKKYQIGCTREYIRAVIECEEDLTGKVIKGRIEDSNLTENGEKLCKFIACEG